MADVQQAILQITQILQKLTSAAPAPVNTEQILENLSANIAEFSFDPDNDVTFGSWFQRYESLFEEDAGKLDDAAKVRLLLRKLDTPSHSRYVNYILPTLPKDVSFADTIATLKKIFGAQTSTFNKRYRCLQLTKSDADDIIAYGGKVNRACEDFDFKKLKIEQFKCLIFVCGLQAPHYADIRARLLSRIEAETAGNPVSLQTLIDEFQRYANLKADTTLIGRPSSSAQAVHAVQEGPKADHRAQRSSRKDSKTPPYPCWKCGQMHFVRNCPFSEHVCHTCNRVGHKEGYCRCVSRSSSASTSTSSSSSEQDEHPVKLKKAPKKQPKVNSRGVFVVNHIASRPSSMQHQELQLNHEPSPSTAKQSLKPGDIVFTRVHRGNSRRWRSAKVVERVGDETYNVFLEDCRRVVRRSVAKLKTQSPKNLPPAQLSPLTILLEDFGLSAPTVPTATTPNLDDEMTESADHSSDEAEEVVPSQSATGYLQRLFRFNPLRTGWLKGGDVTSK